MSRAILVAGPNQRCSFVRAHDLPLQSGIQNTRGGWGLSQALSITRDKSCLVANARAMCLRNYRGSAELSASNRFDRPLCEESVSRTIFKREGLVQSSNVPSPKTVDAETAPSVGQRSWIATQPRFPLLQIVFA